MITLERLTQFTHDDLSYKPIIKVVYYKMLNDWIDLQFDNGKGEVVSAERFYNWINKKRIEKINQIL
jgi:hypothetical protein